MKIAFYKGKGTISDRVIRWWTTGDYSHVEITFSDGVSFSSSGRDKGTRFKKIDFNTDKWDMFQYVGYINDSHESVLGTNIRKWCEAQLGKKYNYRGLLQFVWGAAQSSEHKWYCSQICARALERIRLVSAPERVSPQSLFEIINKSQKWERIS